MSWTLIESQTLSGTAASVTLGSGGTLPQTYKTLRLVISSRNNESSFSSQIRCAFNGSTSSFTVRGLGGNGSSAFSYTAAFGYFGEQDGQSATANTVCSTEITFPNYASASAYKTFSVDGVTENNATTVRTDMIAGLWSNNSAIASITITNDSTFNFLAGSSFTLYGLK